MCVYGTNTDIEEYDADSLQGDAEVSVVIDALDLVEGTYKLDVAVHKRDGAPYDYHRLLYTFRVKSRLKDVGIYRPRHRWEFAGPIKFKPRTEDVLTIDEAAAFAEGLRRRGQDASSSPTASSTCCIPGTFATCRHARSLGDALIVGVNSDRSVRANKGPTRPDHA